MKSALTPLLGRLLMLASLALPVSVRAVTLRIVTYNITASNSPTKYGESGLPAGLSINQTAGKISGTPAKTGTFNVTIAAFNSTGSGSAKLMLTVKPAS